jgi:hypothetical protein
VRRPKAHLEIVDGAKVIEFDAVRVILQRLTMDELVDHRWLITFHRGRQQSLSLLLREGSLERVLQREAIVQHSIGRRDCVKSWSKVRWDQTKGLVSRDQDI